MYADCYFADMAGVVTHARYVEAFYTTRIFKLERLILQWLVSKPSTDAEARSLAAGAVDRFAAWRVEARSKDQILLCDFRGRTRSWLMVAPLTPGTTRLYFGSAVVPETNPSTGETSLGGSYRSLLGFHKIYSQVLLSAARSRLEASDVRQ